MEREPSLQICAPDCTAALATGHSGSTSTCREARKLVQAPTKLKAPADETVVNILMQLPDMSTMSPNDALGCVYALKTAAHNKSDVFRELVRKENMSRLLQLLYLRGDDVEGAFGQAVASLLALLTRMDTSGASTARTAGAIPPLTAALRYGCDYSAEACEALTHIAAASKLSAKVLEQTGTPAIAVSLAQFQQSGETADRALQMLNAIVQKSENPMNTLINCRGEKQCAKTLGIYVTKADEQRARFTRSLLSELLSTIQLDSASSTINQHAEQAIQQVIGELLTANALPFALAQSGECATLFMYMETRVKYFFDPLERNGADLSMHEVFCLLQLLSLSRSSYAIACKAAEFTCTDSYAGSSVIDRMVRECVQHVYHNECINNTMTHASLEGLGGLFGLVHLWYPANNISNRHHGNFSLQNKQLEGALQHILDDCKEPDAAAKQAVEQLEPTAHQLASVIRSVERFPLRLLYAYETLVYQHMHMCICSLGEDNLVAALSRMIHAALQKLQTTYAQDQAHSSSALYSI